MISIQKVDPRQAEQLTQIALAAKAYWGYPARWMEIWRPQLTFTPEYFEQNESWMAVIEGRPIGFYTRRDKKGIAWIEDLWVQPAYIGQGIGKALFLHAVEQSRERSYKTLQLEADPNAVGFYETMGMRKIGERHTSVDSQLRILPVMGMDLES
jgi:ribosomal protein S18 acetylase RimI-like enzyme